MKNVDLAYPFDPEALCLKAKYYLKRTAQLDFDKSKDQKITLKILGGYTNNILEDWITIFAAELDLNIEIVSGFWGPGFLHAASESHSDDHVIYFLHNSLRDLIPECNAHLVQYSVDDIANFIEQFAEKTTNRGHHVIATYFEDTCIMPPATDIVEMSNSKIISLNQTLINLAANYKNFRALSLNNLEHVTETKIFGNSRDWYLYGHCFSMGGSVLLANRIASQIKSFLTGPKKVLVVDLDNTLWGGVIGDDGVSKIELGPDSVNGRIFSDIQSYLLMLRSRGVILAISSKNDVALASEGFSHKHSVLALGDFAAMEINWEAKSSNIQKISKKLNVGLDSLVFIDDNIREREEVKTYLPEILVPSCGENPLDFLSVLEFLDPFDIKAKLTREDLLRADSYSTKKDRDLEKTDSQNPAEFLKKSEIKIHAFFPREEHKDRLLQLTNKTNQFNFTTKRVTSPDVDDFFKNPKKRVFAAEVNDKFGSYGLTCICYVIYDGKKAVIDNWLMSCRIFSKTVEFAVFKEIASHLLSEGMLEIEGSYIPTKRNLIIKDLYLKLGFVAVPDEESVVRYIYNNTFENIQKIEHHCEVVNEL